MYINGRWQEIFIFSSEKIYTSYASRCEIIVFIVIILQVQQKNHLIIVYCLAQQQFYKK